MPKLSIYVADDLWTRVTRQRPGKGDKASPSQIVQEALRALVEDIEARRLALAGDATPDPERFASVVARVRADARKEFESGYEAALQFVEIAGFEALNQAMALGGHLADVVDGFGGPEFEEWNDRYPDRFDDFDEAFNAGADAAVEDLWNALRANRWGTAMQKEASAAEAVDDNAEGQES